MAGLPPAERLRLLPDPRRRRGVPHPFVTVLLAAATAVVSGARSYEAFGRWSANAPQHTPSGWPPGPRGPWAYASHRAPSRYGGSSPWAGTVGRQTIHVISDPDLATGLASKPRPTRQTAMDHREPAALRPRRHLHRKRSADCATTLRHAARRRAPAGPGASARARPLSDSVSTVSVSRPFTVAFQWEKAS
ncbi:transposase family protein [Streptomyces sp. NPDC006487]|uniref:transposase family protein n=1 Tax=Streptomyces sp. NPDC006487 TaxID=3364748 RepID=UPI0036B3C6A8